MKEMKILFYCLVMCGITASSVIYWVKYTRAQNKMAVVDAVRLFDGYSMKIQLETIAKKKLEEESRQLDSISNVLQMAKAVNGSEGNVRSLLRLYSTIKTKLETDYAQSNQDINEQVWKRLNSLLEEYGKANGLHLIIGANGMGSVLFTDDFYDRTNDVVHFINRRYAGGN